VRYIRYTTPGAMADGRRNHTGTAFLTMLEKKGTTMDLIDPITRFVRSQFSDREAMDAADDLTKVQQLRADLLSASQPLEQRKETLFKCAPAIPSPSPFTHPTQRRPARTVTGVFVEQEAMGEQTLAM